MHQTRSNRRRDQYGERLRKRRATLSPSLLTVAEYIDGHRHAVLGKSALDIARETGTSDATVIRAIQMLGFDGLIVTDALDMQGASATYPPDVAPVEAFLAGADQLLIPPKMDTAYAAVLGAVKDGRISRQRLDASVYRILKHKLDNDIFESPYVDPTAAPAVFSAAVLSASAAR